LIAIANPNNPTGSAASEQEILLVAQATPEAAVLVDEAYFEFHGRTLLGARRQTPNLFVVRTFSKAYGLAGLRAGVLMGDTQHMRTVRKVASPYNVNSVALACLPEALADVAYVGDYVAEVCAGRERLQCELQKLGIPYWPSRANFVLMHLGESNAAFVHAMSNRGILVRDRSRDPGCEGCVRITLGSREQTTRLLSALTEVVQEIGVNRQEVRP